MKTVGKLNGEPLTRGHHRDFSTHRRKMETVGKLSGEPLTRGHHRDFFAGKYLLCVDRVSGDNCCAWFVIPCTGVSSCVNNQ